MFSFHLLLPCLCPWPQQSSQLSSCAVLLLSAGWVDRPPGQDKVDAVNPSWAACSNPNPAFCFAQSNCVNWSWEKCVKLVFSAYLELGSYPLLKVSNSPQDIGKSRFWIIETFFYTVMPFSSSFHLCGQPSYSDLTVGVCICICGCCFLKLGIHKLWLIERSKETVASLLHKSEFSIFYLHSHHTNKTWWWKRCLKT